MESFIVFAVLLISPLYSVAQTEARQAAMVSISNNVACPSLDNPAKPVRAPYPFACDKYYHCVNGNAELINCPAGLHWNSATSHCDNPGVVQCQIKSNPIPVMTTTPVIQPTPPEQLFQFTSMNSNGVKYEKFPDACDKYYKCQMVQCPSGLHWNSVTQCCDLPMNAGCPSRGIVQIPKTAAAATMIPSLPVTVPNYTYNHTWETVTSIDSQNYLDQLCSKSGAHYINHPSDCHLFIQCNGIAFIHQCPDNLYWNSQLLTCDHFCI